MKMKSVVVIPTYNEEENIERLVKDILALNLGVLILIVDDVSTDRTREIVDSLVKTYSQVKVIHRKEKRGLGAAYIEGVKYALSLRAEKIITMDADFSHDPEDIPRLLKESEKYDVVVGSRYMLEGKIVNWELWRRLLSWGGIFITKFLLDLQATDCTSSFRCYGRRFLETLEFNKISSQKKAFQVEMLLRAQRRGFYAFEIPIIYNGREGGEPDINWKEILRFVSEIIKLTLRSLRENSLKKRQKDNIYSDEFREKNKNYYKNIENYDWVAAAEKIVGPETFFHRARRKTILNLIRQFGRGRNYLDVGCGTGLILMHLPYQSVGIDINSRNLEKAAKYAPKAKLIEGDVENMPFPDNNFSTIICTEFLEHQPDPRKALQEIKRVLKSEGVLIGSVPSRSLVWKFRFLSHTSPRLEPFHKYYKLKELKRLLLPHFKIIKLSLATWGMNLVFVCKK